MKCMLSKGVIILFLRNLFNLIEDHKLKYILTRYTTQKKSEKEIVIKI